MGRPRMALRTWMALVGFAAVVFTYIRWRQTALHPTTHPFADLMFGCVAIAGAVVLVMLLAISREIFRPAGGGRR